MLNLSNDKEYYRKYMNENIERNFEAERLYLLSEQIDIEQTQTEFIINMYNENISISQINKISKL